MRTLWLYYLNRLSNFVFSLPVLTNHTHTHIKQPTLCPNEFAYFYSNKLDVLWNSKKRKKRRQAAAHPFSSCVGGMRGHRLDCVSVTLCHPCGWKHSLLPLNVEGKHSAGGVITHGEWPQLGSGATPKAKHLCIWIIYCTDSHICISGHFQVTGALWFTPLCQTVLLLVWNRMDIKLVWMQVPSWIFKAAV